MGDVSKKTLAVLLVVAIVLSAIATWKMLGSETVVSVAQKEPTGTSHVSFSIGGEQQPAQPVIETGRVSITIE